MDAYTIRKQPSLNSSNYILCNCATLKYLEDSQRKIEFKFNFKSDILKILNSECNGIKTGIFFKDGPQVRRVCGYISNGDISKIPIRTFYRDDAVLRFTLMSEEYLNNKFNSIF